MPISPEDRKPILITDFVKGVAIKADSLGIPGILRLTGFKFGKTAGRLTTRGGFDNWDLGTDFTYIQGFKRWYRSDGGVDTLLVGKTIGGVHGVFLVKLHSRTLSTLYTITDTDIDLSEPAQWVDCGDQLILIMSSTTSRPLSIKRQESETIAGDGGIVVTPLGLNAPTQGFAAASLVATAGVVVANDIENGEYFYTYTYVYGTASEPELYGESSIGPIRSVQVTKSLSDLVINQLTSLPAVVGGYLRKVRIYRTLKNATTFYRIGEIDVPGRTFFNDSIIDSLVDLSKTLPTLTGIPTAMRCAYWSPTFRRLYWFGVDGYFHVSAATYPDINSLTSKYEVGNRGYPGTYILEIGNTIYAFKEDGIFRVQGTYPNIYSTKVSNVSTASRSTIVEMPDGIYFLGRESGEYRVYRFDGNNAVPLSAPIDPIFTHSDYSAARRAFAKRVGSEYWLSIQSSDLRYAKWAVPYNNVILPYDYRYQAWAGPFAAQAAVIEVFDGPGDRGEVFILESDFTNSASKGNLFKLEETRGSVNNTTYSEGTRLYLANSFMDRKLTVGAIPALTEELGLQKLLGFTIKARIRRAYGVNIIAAPYDDSDTLQQVINTSGTSNFQDGTLEVSSELTDDQKFGTTYGVGTYVDTYVEDYLWNIDVNIPKTGISLDVRYFSLQHHEIDIEAVEIKLKLSEASHG